MAVVGFHRLQELFRKAAGLDIAKGHAKEITDIVEQKLYDLLVVAQGSAKYNDRDVIWLSDVPLTKGMQNSMQEFKKLEEEVELKDILDRLATHPPILELEVELENKLPEIAGALTIILAKIIKEIEPESKTVSHEAIQRAQKILDFTM